LRKIFNRLLNYCSLGFNFSIKFLVKEIFILLEDRVLLGRNSAISWEVLVLILTGSIPVLLEIIMGPFRAILLVNLLRWCGILGIEGGGVETDSRVSIGLVMFSKIDLLVACGGNSRTMSGWALVCNTRVVVMFPVIATTFIGPVRITTFWGLLLDGILMILPLVIVIRRLIILSKGSFLVAAVRLLVVLIWRWLGMMVVDRWRTRLVLRPLLLWMRGALIKTMATIESPYVSARLMTRRLFEVKALAAVTLRLGIEFWLEERLLLGAGWNQEIGLIFKHRLLRWLLGLLGNWVKNSCIYLERLRLSQCRLDWWREWGRCGWHGRYLLVDLRPCAFRLHCHRFK